MDLITSAERDELFETFTDDAFHLELRDNYGNPLEDESLQAWLRGEPDDMQWFQEWRARMLRATGAGKTVRRVRVVTEPLTDYISYEWEGTKENLDAGEDIRWLPRSNVPADLTFPLDGCDWWLFDDRLLAVGHLDSEGRVLGSHLDDDPALVSECARIRDHLWSLAIPHEVYQLVVVG